MKRNLIEKEFSIFWGITKGGMGEARELFVESLDAATSFIAIILGLLAGWIFILPIRLVFGRRIDYYAVKRSRERQRELLQQYRNAALGSTQKKYGK